MGRRIRYRPSLAQEQIPSMGARGNSHSTSNIILVIVVACLLVFAVIVLGGYYLIQNRKFQNEFAPLIEVCQGKRANVASVYSPTPGKHPAIAVRRNSGKSPERCHKTELFSQDDLIVKTIGTAVSDADVQKWAQTYLIK